MGDSEDEYDRKRRDKFRGERSDYREPNRRPPPDDRRRDDWNDRGGGGDWNRNRGGGPPPRQIDYRLGGAPRQGPHEFSPPNKRPRNDWGDRGNDRYGGPEPFPSSGSGYGSYDHPPPQGVFHPPPGPHHHRDMDSHGPQSLLSFKAWLSNQDDSISDQDALTKYAEYKQEFKRQQLNEFFVAHREEEWFKNKYHPDESASRKEEQFNNLKKRVSVFMEFLDKKRFEGLTLDAPHAEKLTKLMDWYVIRLEDGSDELAAKLLNDEPRSNVRRPSMSPTKEARIPEAEKEESKENGTEKKPPKVGSDDGAASDSDEEKKTGGEQESKKISVEAEEDLENGSTEGKPDEEMEKETENQNEDNGNVEAVKEGSPKKKRTMSADSGPQSVGSLDDEEEKGILEAKEAKEEKAQEKPKVEEAEVEELPQLHRTSSVFLRNISPAVTKAEVDAICLKYQGFLRTALADPQPERRWYRRGWVTFKRNVNIKEICWQLNNIRLKDAELGAIVNRDLTRRVRTVNGITPHKTIVRNDIRLAAQVIQFLDSKWNLWDEDPEAEKKESFGVYSTNPVLKNITDYLIEEASAEEEELLAMGGGSDGELEPGESRAEKGNTIERDEELIQVLDRLVLYLRCVHSLDYYNHAEYPYEDDMPNRLGILHARGIPPASNVAMTELQDYNRNFEQKITTFCQKSEPLTDDECKALGKKDEETEVEKFITSNTQELGKDKWLCPLSGKKFKGPEFVRKHIQNKHIEKLEEVKKEVSFFNNYLKDPRRPKPFERKDVSAGGDRGGFPRREPLMSDRGDYPPPFPPYGGGGYGGGGPGYGGGPPRYFGGPGGGYNAPPRGRPDYRGRGGNRPIISYRDLDAPPDMDDF